MPRSTKPAEQKIRLCPILFLAAFLLFVAPIWARLMSPPSMADVRDLSDRAPHVFRGQVMTVTPPSAAIDRHVSTSSVATFRVDRWYRGEESPVISLSFRSPNPIFGNGHDCIDFQPGGYWLVFAVKKGESFEMIDDCIGALAISPLLGPNLGAANWSAQMESDFIAGLADNHQDARLLSIQRLGGLKLPSSREVLRRTIADGDELESKWAVYAALRTGDATVLPDARRLLAAGDNSLPESAIALELKNISDPVAVPELVAILNDSPGETTRSSAVAALSENLKDPKTASVLAAHLSDESPQVRYMAMYGLRNITREPACTLPSGWTEQDIEPQLQQCREWWQQSGRLQPWH